MNAFSKAQDTIAAIATPLGVGGIAIIRISGAQAISIIKKLTRHKTFKKNTVVHTALYEFNKNKKIDQVVVTTFIAPNSYTGEDTIEINCHGSIYLAKKVLEEVIKAGANLAGPGEFTKRAFLAGKIDLTQVEAVAEMIAAKTDLSAQLALQHLEGSISKEIKKIRRDFVELLSAIEAAIDFPEEINPPSSAKIRLLYKKNKKALEALLQNSNKGLLIRQGLTIALAGKTNVGKSSLFNYLCRENKAIVTHLPGTTRDALEAEISIGGIKATLIDTAGLRQTRNRIETLGIAKSKEYLDSADLVLYLLDTHQGFTSADQKIISATKNKNIIYVLNKIDLRPNYKFKNALKISAKTGQGIATLENKILEVMDLKNLELNKQNYVSSFRQKEKLLKLVDLFQAFQPKITPKIDYDLIAIDIKNIIYVLGEITGDQISEEAIKYIFDNFCVGK